MEKLKTEVKTIMKRVFHIDIVSDNISQENCSSWDSLHHLNLVVELEEKFEISFEPEQIAKMKNLDIILEEIRTFKKNYLVN